MKLLVAEDEPKTGTYLQQGLTEAGFNVDRVMTGTDALQHALSEAYDLLILDVMMPGLDGWEVLRMLRAAGKDVPVLFLTARDGVEDRVKGLELGADDYLIKPFAFSELLARVRAALRSGEKTADEAIITSENIIIDLASHVVRKNEEIIKLTSTEYNLLVLLAQNRGRVLTHQYILKEVWGFGYVEQSQYLRVFIAQLRKKLEDCPSKPSIIITESGIGYRFN